MERKNNEERLPFRKLLKEMSTQSRSMRSRLMMYIYVFSGIGRKRCTSFDAYSNRSLFSRRYRHRAEPESSASKPEKRYEGKT